MLALIVNAVKGGGGGDIVFLCLVQIQPVKSPTHNLQTFYCGYIFFSQLRGKSVHSSLVFLWCLFQTMGKISRTKQEGNRRQTSSQQALNSNKHRVLTSGLPPGSFCGIYGSCFKNSKSHQFCSRCKIFRMECSCSVVLCGLQNLNKVTYFHIYHRLQK